MPLTAREFDTIVRKFGFEVRESGEGTAEVHSFPSYPRVLLIPAKAGIHRGSQP